MTNQFATDTKSHYRLHLIYNMPQDPFPATCQLNGIPCRDFVSQFPLITDLAETQKDIKRRGFPLVVFNPNVWPIKAPVTTKDVQYVSDRLLGAGLQLTELMLRT